MDAILVKSGTLAFLISIICTPFLIKLSLKKGLLAAVDHRSSHAYETPNTGGIVLGFATVIPLLTFSNYPKQDDFSFLLSAFAVLLITGVIDDFNPIPVFYKFLGQFIPAIVIVLSFEEQELMIPFISEYMNLPSFFNYLFWIVFIVMSINAFNLIDGIDGLAICLGIAGGMFYLIQFLELGEDELTIFSVALVGGLLGLLVFNLSKRNKIFLGDTGSLLIGGLLVFFGLNFISKSEQGPPTHAFFLVLGSFFLPFADMIRVALVRLLRKESPFKADRLHIHHVVVDACRGNHALATTLLVFVQILILVLFQAINLTNHISIVSAIILALSFYILFVYLFRKMIRLKD